MVTPSNRTVALVLAAAVWLEGAGQVEAGGGPQNVLLVVNPRSPASLEVANEYQRLRNLPEKNIFYLPETNGVLLLNADGTPKVGLGEATLIPKVLTPIRDYLLTQGLTNQIDYLVYAPGIPLYAYIGANTGPSGDFANDTSVVGLSMALEKAIEMVTPATNSAWGQGPLAVVSRGSSFSSGNPLTWTTNITRQSAWRNRLYMTSVLGWTGLRGNTIEEVKRMLQRSAAVDGTHPSGVVYLDASPGDARNRASHYPATQSELTLLGVPWLATTNGGFQNRTNIIGGACGLVRANVAGNVFLPGSFADNLTSYSGNMENGEHTLCTLFVAAGTSGSGGAYGHHWTSGYNTTYPRFHAHYRRGCSLGEAYALAMYSIAPPSWMIVGDPLTQPYAFAPVVNLGGLAETNLVNDADVANAVSGTLSLTPMATTVPSRQIAEYDLFLDGLPWRRVAPGAVATMDTTTLADGWHELRVVAYEAPWGEASGATNDIRTQGSLTAQFAVDNSGHAVEVSARELSVPAGQTNLLLSVNARGGSPSTIEVRKGAFVVGAVSGASGTVSVAVSRLGVGRSVLRAAGTIGGRDVVSAPVVVTVTGPEDTSTPVISGVTNLYSTYYPASSYANVFMAANLNKRIGILTNFTASLKQARWGSWAAPTITSWQGEGTNYPWKFRWAAHASACEHGTVPFILTATDEAGQSTSYTGSVAVDFRPPAVVSLAVAPAIVHTGQAATVSFTLDEPATNVSVMVGTEAAAFVSSNGLDYVYRYTPSTTTPYGVKAVTVATADKVGSAGGSSLATESFDTWEVGLAAGAYAGSGWAGSYVVVTNNPTAGGSAAALVFSATRTTSSCTWQMARKAAKAKVDFDLRVANAGQAAATANKVRFVNSDFTSVGEVELVISQAVGAVSDWGLVLKRPEGDVTLRSGLALHRWYHISFANDIVSNTCAVTLDGEVLYDGGYTATTNLTQFGLMNVLDRMDCTQTGAELVFLDNVKLEGGLAGEVTVGAAAPLSIVWGVADRLARAGEGMRFSTALWALDGPLGLEYFVDGQKVGERGGVTGFQDLWTWPGATVGSHEVTVRVTDGLGRVVTAPAIAVTVIPAGLTRNPLAAAILNGFHALRAYDDGSVRAWGDNEYGQLGVDFVAYTNRPCPVPGVSGIVSVAAGEVHSLALGTDGVVRAWGANYSGQLGDGTGNDSPTPVTVSNLTNAVMIAAGASHNLALDAGGRVWVWGGNGNGQLGLGSTVSTSMPTRIASLSNIVMVAAGSFHSLALGADGGVWAWGSNGYGQLGDGSTTQRNAPVRITALQNVFQVAAGSFHSFALRKDGTLLGWGANADGQLGDGTTTQRTAPVAIPVHDAVSIAAGGVYGTGHSLALLRDGTVRAWGENDFGQLGDGTTTTRTAAVSVNGLTNQAVVAAGRYSSLALGADGVLRAWGDNASGQLGDGTSTRRTRPVYVLDPGLPAPLLDVSAPAAFSFVTNDAVSALGTATGVLGACTVRINGTPAATVNGYTNWSAIVPGLTAGPNVLDVVAVNPGEVGRPAVRSLTVVYADATYSYRNDSRTLTNVVDGVTNVVTVTVPDSWKIRYFGPHFLDDVRSGGDADPMSTGMPNWQRYIAGLDPLDPADRLEFTEPEGAAGDPAGTLRWRSKAGKDYRVEYSPDLRVWHPVNPGITATSPVTTWTDDGSGTGSPPVRQTNRFYRVTVPF